MNKTVKKLLVAGACVAGAMYVTNYLMDKKTYRLKKEERAERGQIYRFRHGDVFFVKKGEGSPILLIHDISPELSHKDWDDSINEFTEGHTVYALDLLGCGRSDKPKLIYSNYMYVELITSFIKDVIGEKTTVIATGTSCSAALMAANMDKDIISKLMFINPAPLLELAESPNKVKDKALLVFGLPIIGEFIYNMFYLRSDDEEFLEAHRGRNLGRFLLMSMLGRYTNINITHALKKAVVPIVLLGDKNEAERYKSFNENIELVNW
ncbi:MAG: hypothetical protein K6E13_06415 [Lachnospiraceae bacterium]|nr:hypothetical protein [Lachnospiraceae bacterium]